MCFVSFYAMKQRKVCWKMENIVRDQRQMNRSSDPGLAMLV